MTGLITAKFSQAGVDIVPVYGLGHTQLFSMLDKSSALGGFLMRMSRRLKAGKSPDGSSNVGATGNGHGPGKWRWVRANLISVIHILGD